MNQDTINGSWTELKGKIRAKFGKLTDDDMETFKGNLQQLSGKIQTVYGYAKEKADQECDEFRANYHALTRDVKAAIKPVKDVSRAV